MIEVKVPDIGDFTDVPVIEVLVAVGDTLEAEAPMVTLESDKATMEVPAPAAGVVKELRVKVGDKVSEGTLLLMLEPSEADTEAPTEAAPAQAADAAPAPAAAPDETADAAPASAAAPAELPAADHRARVVVLGSGPGGYTAAFRAADLGLETILVERYPSLGGVCLNVGCIPSKALLHTAKVISEAQDASAHGISFGPPEIDVEKLRTWKESVVGKLTGGLVGLAKRRKVTVLHGTARFDGPHTLVVETSDGDQTVAFENCIIAAGSQAASLPFLPDDERVMDSTGALELPELPKKLLVIGGGIIGLEMATVYEALGAEVTVVELLDQLIPGCDPDLVRPLHKRIEKRYAAIHLETRVEEVKAQKNGLKVTFAVDDGEPPKPKTFDRILVAVGRRANGNAINADAAGVKVDERGFIAVDKQQRTNVAHIYAIGDIVGEPMLAHKASHEGRVAAEVIAGHDVVFDALSIPAVAYTDPEVAWTGLTETQAKADGIKVDKATFPWAASGRALSVGREDGATKLLVDPSSRRVLGAGIVGVGAGELIAEVAHAIEMGATAEDIGLTIHPHPTLSETVMFAAEAVEGTITDLYMPKRR